MPEQTCQRLLRTTRLIPTDTARLWRGRDSESGSAAVEFALLLPVYLLLFLGMTAYALYFGATHSVQQLSADTARAAVSGLDAEERNQIAASYIEENAGRYILIDPSGLAAEISDRDDGKQFDVMLTYDASSLPIWSMWKGLPLPDRNIRRGSTVRIGGI